VTTGLVVATLGRPSIIRHLCTVVSTLGLGMITGAAATWPAGGQGRNPLADSTDCGNLGTEVSSRLGYGRY
jgi:hypothetical protein